MRVTIEGMHCDGCVRRVRKALEKTPGVNVEDVRVGYADVSVAPDREAAMLEAIRSAGFEPHT